MEAQFLFLWSHQLFISHHKFEFRSMTGYGNTFSWAARAARVEVLQLNGHYSLVLTKIKIVTVIVKDIILKPQKLNVS